MSFSREISNVLYAAERNPIDTCIQCGTCSGTCPAAEFMEHSPRQIIAMVRAGQRDRVLSSNTFWTCASCYECTVKCPKDIDIAYMMYGLKRYSLWRGRYPRKSIGPDFSKRFVRMILTYGRSWEPGLAIPYLFRRGLADLFYEGWTAVLLLVKGRLPLFPKRTKRSRNLARVLSRIVPMGRVA